MKHVAVMSSTASIGLMAIFAVDFIDMIFIAMLGNEALAAAVGYAGTILFFTTSIALGLSISAGALVAKALGAKDQLKAREVASSVLMFGLGVSVVTVVAVLWGLSGMLDFLGAKGETKMLAMQYLWIIIPSMPVMVAARWFRVLCCVRMVMLDVQCGRPYQVGLLTRCLIQYLFLL